MANKRPLVLTILDGWGFSPAVEGNAIAAARKPDYDELLSNYPNTLIHTSGPFVGLPDGQMGNSEVGHMNMGAGRVIYMDVTRIDLLISSGEFFNNPALAERYEKGGRPSAAPDWTLQRWRRACATHPSLCAAGDGEEARTEARVRSLLHGWPRHAAGKWRRLYRAGRRQA